MKKLIETMIALAVAIVLMGALIGCGNSTVDQGKVNTKPPDPKDMEKEMGAGAAKGKEDIKGGGSNPNKKGGGGGSGSDPLNPGGGGDALNPGGDFKKKSP